MRKEYVAFMACLGMLAVTILTLVIQMCFNVEHFWLVGFFISGLVLLRFTSYLYQGEKLNERAGKGGKT